ncbi:MAG: tetratricopeptide repeat protein, partial [Anaerolineae bacterium]|nr:tetratricopeptide repeat protein [Anaerolineae bacterium]
LSLLRESEPVVSLPEGANLDELLETAERAMQTGDFETAAEALEKLVEQEPQHTSGWSLLGRARLSALQVDEAIEAFEKQLEVNAYSEDANLFLAMALAMKGDYEGAEAAAKRQLEINPLDYRARFALAQVYKESHRYEEAVAQLEALASQRPDDLHVQQSLAEAYLETGLNEKALQTLEQLADLEPIPFIWNNVAYLLAEKKVHLEQAQAWAESAVKQTATDLGEVNLSDVSRKTLAAVSLLVASWDTLGWVYFQQGRIEEAEEYILAAWVTGQHATVGEHLAEIYETKGQHAKAESLRKLVEGAPRDVRGFSDFYQRNLAGQREKEKVVRVELKNVEELQNMRTVKLARRNKASGQAEFYVLLAPGPTVEEVKFISGSEELKDWTETLKEAQFPVEFPDDTPT